MLTLGLSIAGSSAAIAGAIEDGVSANQKGDYATALAIFRPLAEQGNVDAQFGLGAMYWDGHGVAQDLKEAVKWFQLASAQGHANAQFALGLMYANGQGVLKNKKEAVKWYRLAAAQGFASAQNTLGAIYYGGRHEGLRHHE